jgi:hypothetical protein
VSEIVTTGTLLPGGGMIEQLTQHRLLLALDGHEQIGSLIDHAGLRFVPAVLNDGYEKALKLPDRTAHYGSLGALIKRIAGAFQDGTEFDARQSLLIAGFVLASWVPEFVPMPPMLNVYGQPGTETAVLAILSFLCRHPLPLIDPSLRQLASLPQGLSPTIFLRHPADAALQRLHVIANNQVVLCGRHFLQLCSPVVAFTARPVSVQALRLKLPTSGVPYRRILQPQIQDLREIQRQLLKYRVARHQQVAGSRIDVPGYMQETRVIARTLGACLEGDAILQMEMIRVLQDHDEAAKAASALSLDAIVLEALLALIHEGYDQAYVREIRELAEHILLGRQNPAPLRDQNIGQIVREGLGLSTYRGSQGVYLRLDAATAAAIHREAYSRGVLSLLEPRSDCVFCGEVVRAAISSLADEACTPSASSAPSTQLHPSETPRQRKSNARRARHG